MPYPIWHLTFEIVGAYENDHPDFEINVSTEDAQGTELPTDSVLEPAITNLAKIAICKTHFDILKRNVLLLM
jgi:hypothetical protein